MAKSWCESHEATVALQAGVLQMGDVALQRAIPMDVLLNKTKLFATDLQNPSTLLSAKQLAQLFRNASFLLSRPDLPLVIGQQLLPISLQHFGLGVMHAANVAQALDYLLKAQSLWSPLLHVTALKHEGHLSLYWSDAGAHLDPEEFTLAVLMEMEALRSILFWLGADLHASEWTFELKRLSTNILSECQSRWAASPVKTDCERFVLTLPKTLLHEPLKQASSSLFHVSEQQVAQLPLSFLGFIQQRLLQEIREMPSLETLAEEMAISPATLKRKLKAHGTSYQKQMDQARSLMSYHYSHKLGYSTERVAESLNFYDTSNFRRAMKRWILAS